MSLRFKRFHGSPTAVFIDMEGCLLDAGCMVTVNAIQDVFKENGIDITDVEASTKPGPLVGTDLTCKKTQLRHVLMDVCKDKWTAAKGASPTEWDLEALFKEFPRVVSDRLNTTKPINGAVEVVNGLKAQGLKVAITSNFSGETMAHWGRVAKHNGIEPDTMMSCVDVPNPGREGAFTCVLPDPWRCMALAGKLNIFPLSTIIRVSSTPYGVEEGLNAGMWTVALAGTGLVDQFRHGSETEAMRQKRVQEGFYALGSHYVLDGVWDLPKAIADIEMRMARGESP